MGAKMRRRIAAMASLDLSLIERLGDGRDAVSALTVLERHNGCE